VQILRQEVRSAYDLAAVLLERVQAAEQAEEGAVMSELSAQEMEAKVRARWDVVEKKDHSNFDRFRNWKRTDSVAISMQSEHCFSSERVVSAPTEIEAWQSAYAFTVEREEEIRLVEEEIAWLQSAALVYRKHLEEAPREWTVLGKESDVIGCRVLAREQAALAELKRGMR
jgi:hypothetical protein